MASGGHALLDVSQLTEAQIVGYAAGVRPCRKGGVRLEIEPDEDKLVVHNYGHGGSGITLSWGSAEIAIELFEELLSRHPEWRFQRIAVIGSGVIGLTTAHLLLDRGYQVQIYAKDFPPHTTSDIAPSIWSKILVDNHLTYQQKSLLDKMEALSFAHFHSLTLHQARFQGVSYVDVYTFKRGVEDTKKNLPQELGKTCREVEVQFKNQKKKGVFFRTIFIETSAYMQDLYEQLQQKNTVCIEKNFQSKEDLKRLPESIIFNCTGLGSKELFQDQMLFGVRGQLIYLAPQEKMNYILAGPVPEAGLDVYMIPLKDRIALGGSYEYNGRNQEAYDPEICEKIFKHSQLFLYGEKNDDQE